MSIFGDRVAEARRRKNWSQRDLADALGYKSEDAIGAWETREVIPKVPAQRAAADALDVTLEYLVGESDDPERAVPGSRRGDRLPPRAYEVVYGYTEKLRAIGLTADEIDEAERTLREGAFNKINSREPGEKSEEDMILDIKAAWQFVRDVVNRNGKKL